MNRIFIAVLAAMLAVVFTTVDGGFAQTSADQNCLGWERDMRSAAGYDDLGRPVLDRLEDDASYGQLLNAWVDDNCMRLNYVQVLGTHNSYHIQPRAPLLDFLKLLDPRAAGLEYTHRPLDEQLDMGIRQVELDIYADPEGGLFKQPLGQIVFPTNPPTPDPIKSELEEPGLKVLHIPDIDFESTCLTFVICLQALEDWSEANPGHLPITIQVEAKDEGAPPVPPGILPPGLPPPVVPIPFGSEEMDSIDAEILSVFSEDQLITPDDVRGNRNTLQEAVLKDGWPTLNESREKFLFTLDNEGVERDIYIAGHPSLTGRVMFTSSPPRSAESAFVKLNDPVADGAQISALVAAGYIVRTRADEDTIEARTYDFTRSEAALASGAHFVSTDYPEPNPAFSPYFVDLPGDDVARCNPILSPPGCDSSEFEH